MFEKLNLQLFAAPDLTTDVPTPVNKTTNNTTGSNDLSPEMKTFYDTALIRLAEPDLIYDRFGQKRPIPQGNGKTIEFRKFDSLPKNTTALTEGVTPTGRQLNVTAKTATVAQYGDYVATSDVLQLTAIDPIVSETTRILASQAARTSDTITRDIIMAGTNVIYSHGTSRASVTDSYPITLDLIRDARLQLRRNNAPTIDGSYICILHPDVARDLRGLQGFLDIVQYGDPDRVYDGEIGKIEGVRFFETTEAPIWKTGTAPNQTTAYGCLFLGADAYGVTDVNGGGLRMIVKNLGSAGAADPLDQRSTIGWKLIKTAIRLVEEYMVRVECGASNGSNAQAN